MGYLTNINRIGNMDLKNLSFDIRHEIEDDLFFAYKQLCRGELTEEEFNKEVLSYLNNGITSYKHNFDPNHWEIRNLKKKVA